MENEKILYNTGYGLSNSDSMQKQIYMYVQVPIFLLRSLLRSCNIYYVTTASPSDEH